MKLYRFRIVHDHGIWSEFVRAEDLGDAMQSISLSDRTHDLVKRGSHIEITLEPTGMVQPP